MARSASKNHPLVEVRRISISERLSEETLAFAADVFVKGRRVGHADNDGHGGNTNVRVPHTPDIRDAFIAFADTLPYDGDYPSVRTEGPREGTTTCCNAFTTVADGGKEACKACFKECHPGYFGGVYEHVVDHLVEAHREAKFKAREEKKLAKIDRQQCEFNDKAGCLTMRYAVETPKGLLSVWSPIKPGQTPEQIASELDAKYKNKGEWKVVS
jgi:hypothetical protein